MGATEGCLCQFLILFPSFDDKADLLALDTEPVELLRDKSGKGQRLRAYPLLQFKLVLRLNRQKDLEFCFSYTSLIVLLISLELSFFRLFCVGSGGGASGNGGLGC